MSFMDLAPEIRVKVYVNLLCSDSEHPIRPFDASLHIRLCDQSLPVYTTNWKLHPSILRVSKQVYAEASHVLYTSNTFTLDLEPSYGAFPSGSRSLDAGRWSVAATNLLAQLTNEEIHSRNLRRMRHILIQIDNDSLSLRKDGPFTPFQNTPFQKDIPSRVTGKILTKVLACLGTGSELEEVEADTQRTLKLHILIPRARTDGYTPTELEWEDRKMRADIRWYLRLLGEVKRRRKVDVVLDVVYQGVSVGKIDLEQLDLALD